MGLTKCILDADTPADALELIIHEGEPINVLDGHCACRFIAR